MDASVAQIFVNLKRFDVPRSMGGICPIDKPGEWIRSVIQKTMAEDLGGRNDVRIVYFVPESLLIPAQEELGGFDANQRINISIGCQSVFRENIQPDKNFGAFTSNLPSAAAANLGIAWSIIGHSEERKDKLGILSAYDPDIENRIESRERALKTINQLINEEALRAFEAGIDVLLCIGETAEERGEGSFEEQQIRVKSALRSQIEIGFSGVSQYFNKMNFVVGYEPIWAIGPGKTPPGAEYITFVSEYIKNISQEIYGFKPPVVYGGGLKEENAGMIGGISSIDGGLVALTKFTQPIAFDPIDLRIIVDKYIEADKNG